MLTKYVRGAVVGMAIVVGALAGTGSAQAAVYSGNWDPAYDGIFDSLGWNVSAELNVPTACLAQADGSYGATGACAGFAVLSAQLNFYNVASPGTILESFALNDNVFVNGIDIAGGQFVGMDTGYFGAVVPSGGSMPYAGGGDYAFSLILYHDTLAQLVYTDPTTASPVCASIPTSDAVCGYSANVGVGTFTLAAVPEPETYVLMLTGLGALGWMARRRGNRAPQV